MAEHPSATLAPGVGFSLAREAIALPPGASARAARALLTRGGEPVLAFAQGPFRPCLHPLLSPAGYCVSAERPVDHPHHAGVWIAAERVSWVPAAGPGEAHTYNFYVDEVFQGRAPGRIVETGIACTEDARGARVAQSLEWRGPPEWGSTGGRLVLTERRVTRVACTLGRNVVDVVSTLSAPGGAVEIGPTRHAYFNVRVAERMTLGGAAQVFDSRGRTGGEAVSGEGAGWVCMRGPVGADAAASVTVLAAPGSGGGWFVADWGVITVGPFRGEPGRLAPGEGMTLRYRVVVRDGECEAAQADADHRDYLADLAALGTQDA